MSMTKTAVWLSDQGVPARGRLNLTCEGHLAFSDGSGFRLVGLAIGVNRPDEAADYRIVVEDVHSNLELTSALLTRGKTILVVKGISGVEIGRAISVHMERVSGAFGSTFGSLFDRIQVGMHLEPLDMILSQGWDEDPFDLGRAVAL